MSDVDKAGSVMSDEETEYSNMSLRSRRKQRRDLTGGKTLSVEQKIEKQLALPVLEMFSIQYTQKEGLEKAILPVGPKKKKFTTPNFPEPINSEHNEWVEVKSAESIR